jgi:pimeloyl-ACP methyl ester carboxylesterase
VLKPPECTDTDAFSACFFIRYAEEVARLQHVFTYRLTSRADLTLTLRLLFHETNRFCNLSQAKVLSDTLTVDEFEEISRTSVSFINIGSSFHEYVAATFPEPQLSVVHITIHTALLEFKVQSMSSDLVEQWRHVWFYNSTGTLSHQDVKSACEKQLMQLVLSGDKLKAFLSALGEENPKISKIEIPSRPVLDVCESPWSTEQLKTQLSATLEGQNCYQVADCLLKVCQHMSWYVAQLSDSLEKVLLKTSEAVCLIMKQSSLMKMKGVFSHTYTKTLQQCTDFSLPADMTMPQRHTAQVKEQRRRLQSVQLELNAYDCNSWEPLSSCPILFEDCMSMVSTPTPSPPLSGVHLVVLVHGFQGSAYDFKRFKNYMTVYYPEALAFCSSSNEGDTGNSIELMGERLSIEVLNYIEEWVKGDLAKVSFVGHSIGGLIIRAALPHLGSLRDKMHSYISLSTPHLGCLYHNSLLVDFGLRFFRSWNKCQSLSQLTFQDADSIENTFLYRLSCYPGLSWFRNVALLSSCQDQYVAYDTARNEIPAKAFKDAVRGSQIAQMVDNMSSMLTCPQLIKLDVHFKFKKKSLDSVIGRAAHIQFIDDPVFIRQFLVCYPELFN